MGTALTPILAEFAGGSAARLALASALNLILILVLILAHQGAAPEPV